MLTIFWRIEAHWKMTAAEGSLEPLLSYGSFHLKWLELVSTDENM